MRQKCYNYEVMRSHRLRCVQPPSSWGVSIKTVSTGASRRDGFFVPEIRAVYRTRRLKEQSVTDGGRCGGQSPSEPAKV
jgi:hypothetical protein